MKTSTGKEPTSSTRAISEPAFVALVGFAVLALISIAALLFESSTSLLVAVLIVTTSFAAYKTFQSFQYQQQRTENFIRSQSEELRDWQDRWQKLQQETQDATSALVRMRDGVIMLGADDRVLLINPAAIRLLGIAETVNINERPFRETVRHPDLNQAIKAASAGDGSQKLKLELQDGDIVRPLKIRVDHFGSIVENHLLITLRDETDTHRVESMRREFIANISHELKTPLAAIKGYAETVELAIKDDPEAATHFMHQIHSQCLRLEKLVADMMQLARAQAGGSHLNLVDTSLVEPVQESLRSLEQVAESKKIKLTLDTPDTSPVVRADPEALLTITNNLISNAVRYTPEGGNIRVYFRDAGTHWSLVVEDDGIGIAEIDQKRIFERFYRVGQRSDSPNGGTGIGLSIVKNLILTLGGEVRVSSRPGEGAKFEALLSKGSTSRKNQGPRETTEGEALP